MGGLRTICFLLMLGLWSHLSGYAANTPESYSERTEVPSDQQTEFRLFLQDSAWRRLGELAPQFPPNWHYRYTEVRSIAEDVDDLGQDIELQLDELSGVFTRAQHNLDFLLLDMPRIYRSARESGYTERILQQTVWYLELKYGDAKVSAETLDLYVSTLDGFAEMLRRTQEIGTLDNAALTEALPLLFFVHAQLKERVDHLHRRLQNWLVPAGVLLHQMQDAQSTIERSLPDLWLKYYSIPLRISYHGWIGVKNDLEEMQEALLNNVFFPRQILIILLFDIFIIGVGVLLFRTARRSVERRSEDGTSVRQVIFNRLDALSAPRKISLIACTLCAVNILLDAMPSVHLYVPLIVIQSCIMTIAMGIWARGTEGDPPLILLVLPVMVGLVLLYADAPPLWAVAGYGLVLFLCALALYLVKGDRSPFFYLWLSVLTLGSLVCVAGLGRVLVPLFATILAFRVGYVVLKNVRQIKSLNDNILGLTLFTPFCAAVLYSLGLLYIMGCPGVTALVVYWQPNALEISGLQLQLRNLFFLLMLIPVGVSLGQASQEFLLRVAHGKTLLDTSAVPVIHAVVNGFLWVVFCFIAMGFMGVDIRSLAFIGGALTVGLGLGLQGIVSNFFSGLVIVFAKVVRAGDQVEVEGVRGWVRSVNMRSTVVETLDNAVLMVPNLEMLNKRVINWTQNNRSVRESVLVRVSRQENMEQVMAVLERVAAHHPGIQPVPEPVVLLSGFGENSIDFVLRATVRDASQRYTVISALRKAVLDAFIEEGIMLYSPQLKVTVTPPQDEGPRS